ncbi:MAG: hypothetical protein MUF53_03950, partial [Gemmatimonadaceae bacterium]|nr:hypothetical protein [Gemmatimonadaceae bacterium]
DLVAVAGDDVLLFLDAARPKDLRAFVERWRDGWAATGRAPFALDLMAYPGDEARVRASFDLGVPAA